MALSEEDKRRIEEEEAYRAQVRANLENTTPPTTRDGPKLSMLESLGKKGLLQNRRLARSILGVSIVVFLFGIMISGLDKNTTESSSLANEKPASDVRSNAPLQTQAPAPAKTTIVGKTPVEEVAVEEVDITFTSDPRGAELFIGGTSRGRTPVTVSLTLGQEITYTLKALELNEEFDSYVEFEGKFTPTKDDAVSVYLTRTSEEVRASQRTAYRARNLSSLQGDVRINCENLIKQGLKAPGTAKFGGWYDGAEYSYDAEEGTAWYASYVDAENVFGALLRSQFACSYSMETDRIQLEYFLE
jgi:hypothetical protein